MTINDRIRELRKDHLKMSMEKFGEMIGISKSGVSEIESGRRNVTDQHIRLLTTSSILGRTVSAKWLRDGEGEMFVQRTRNQAIADYLNEVMEDDGSSFRARFIEALSRLDMDDWLVIEKLVDAIATKKEES